jgi:leader peptidase (prepilin peptidase) / N-methyltransferase
VSVRYLIIEIISAALVVGIGIRFHFALVTIPMDIAALGLWTLAIIDAEFLLLPRRITFVTTSLVLPLLLVTSSIDHEWTTLLEGLLCATIWVALFLLIHVLNHRWMGVGDVFLAGLLGLVTGYLGVASALVAFFIANVIGALTGVVLVATKRMRRDEPLPYGVFLVVGALTVMLWGPQLLTVLHAPSY